MSIGNRDWSDVEETIIRHREFFYVIKPATNCFNAVGFNSFLCSVLCDTRDLVCC